MKKNMSVLFAGVIMAVLFAACIPFEGNLDEVREKANGGGIRYTVKFESDGGSYVSSQKVKAGEAVDRPTDPIKGSVLFGGWYSDNQCTIAYNFSSPVTANITLYARWVPPAADQYTVSFNSNGGSKVDNQDVYEGGSPFRPVDPIRDGYAFDNWYTDSSFTLLYDFTAPIYNHTVIVAKWNPVYTVTFDSNGGSGVTIQSVVSGSLAVIPSPPPNKNNYSFAGWYTDVGLTIAYVFSTPVTYSFTLYAKWNVVYTVQYNANRPSGLTGSGSMANTSHTEGIAANLRVNAFTCRGYEFIGWATMSSATVAAYSDGQSVVDLTTVGGATVTLYAVWSKVTIVPGASLSEKFTWLSSNVVSNTVYTVLVTNATSSLSACNLSWTGYTDVTICIKSDAAASRIINMSSASGSLFTVGNGYTLVLGDETAPALSDITLIGHSGSTNSGSLVRVNSGGVLIMNTGTAINDNTNYIMTGSTGGGVYVAGEFTMNGGTISGNNASSATGSSGGGVYIEDSGIFIMLGGIITKNSASQGYGGGVYVASNGTFSKTGSSIITGYPSDAVDGNTVNSSMSPFGPLSGHGHAVYKAGSPVKRWESTAGSEVNMSYSPSGGATGSWEY